MPNEKKSACVAMRSATKHARGSSIIVPMISARDSLPSSSATRVTRSRISSSSFS